MCIAGKKNGKVLRGDSFREIPVFAGVDRPIPNAVTPLQSHKSSS